MHNIYCYIYIYIYQFYRTNAKVIDSVCNLSEENSIMHLSKHFVICFFINLGIIHGANLYYVNDFVCIMCTK